MEDCFALSKNILVIVRVGGVQRSQIGLLKFFWLAWICLHVHFPNSLLKQWNVFWEVQVREAGNEVKLVTNWIIWTIVNFHKSSAWCGRSEPAGSLSPGPAVSSWHLSYCRILQVLNLEETIIRYLVHCSTLGNNERTDQENKFLNILRYKNLKLLAWHQWPKLVKYWVFLSILTRDLYCFGFRIEKYLTNSMNKTVKFLTIVLRTVESHGLKQFNRCSSGQKGCSSCLLHTKPLTVILKKIYCNELRVKSCVSCVVMLLVPPIKLRPIKSVEIKLQMSWHGTSIK